MDERPFDKSNNNSEMSMNENGKNNSNDMNKKVVKKIIIKRKKDTLFVDDDNVDNNGNEYETNDVSHGEENSKENKLNNSADDKEKTKDAKSTDDYYFDTNIGSFIHDSPTKEQMGHQIESQLPKYDEEEKPEIAKYKLIQSVLNLNKILKLNYLELIDLAKQMGLLNFKFNTKQDFIFHFLKIHTSLSGAIYAEGVLETKGDFGFLRFSNYSYIESSDDIYVAPTQIKIFGMRTGDSVAGYIRSPNFSAGEKYFAIERVDKINGENPNNCKTRVAFENLIPIFPDKKVKLEYQPEKYATRLLDLFAPVGVGQRGLIVAPPKAGKTIILQEIANSIKTNNPSFEVIILLIDERPEEVTDMKENVPSAEVVSSTFDELPQRHVKVAEIVIEKAKRLVEYGKNVVILLDSITRLARAYNLTVQASGKVLSGGVDANALSGPKKFFGAARNIRGGGSLTILATAIVETGSKMDEVIFEEFKGTGNMEVSLLRKLADRRLFPAIDLVRSSTRKEELLLDEDTRVKVWALRKVLADMDETEAIVKVLDKLKNTKTNKEFSNMIGM